MSWPRLEPESVRAGTKAAPLRAPGWRCPWFRLRLSSLRSQAGGQDPEGLSFGQTASATIRSIELSM